MNEKRILALLARKLAKEATPEELAELENLLAIYPDALYYDEALKQLWQNESHDQYALEEAFERHFEKHAQHFDQEETVETVPSEHGLWRTLKYSILAVAASLIAVVYYQFSRDFENPKNDKSTQIFANKGVRKKIVLPDGTQVWLNSESRITFDPEMKEKSSRVVQLSGEAFFDVVKDKRHPFVIHTDKISIKVLGTAFNVKAYPGDKNAEATLIRGSIELSVNDRPQQKIVLKPSEKFALIEKKEVTAIANSQAAPKPQKITLVIENIAPVEIANTTYIEETSWKDNKLVFQNQSLEQLVPKFERWFNVDINIKSEEAKNYRFTGVFTTENLTQALTAMKLIRNFNYKLENDDVIIY
jgi:ferric-dicitrate binding protein FerR (iron transport regulator)